MRIVWRQGILRLGAAGALGLQMVLSLAGCSSSAPVPRLSSITCAAARAELPAPKTTTAAHTSYQLVSLGPLSQQNHRVQKTWRVGDSMQFYWCAIANSTYASARPVAEELTFTLQGPYASFEAANAARPSPLNAPSNPMTPKPTVYGPVVASAAPVQTNNWSSKDERSTIRLSEKLAPGYYLFVLDIITKPAEPQSGLTASEGPTSGIVEVTG